MRQLQHAKKALVGVVGAINRVAGRAGVEAGGEINREAGIRCGAARAEGVPGAKRSGTGGAGANKVAVLAGCVVGYKVQNHANVAVGGLSHQCL